MDVDRITDAVAEFQPFPPEQRVQASTPVKMVATNLEFLPYQLPLSLIAFLFPLAGHSENEVIGGCNVSSP